MKKEQSMEKKIEKITKDDNLSEVVFKYPQLAEILLDYGLHCVGCFASSVESIEMGAKVHGMNGEEVSEMVDRLNEVLRSSE